jgi:hypothetical protein
MEVESSRESGESRGSDQGELEEARREIDRLNVMKLDYLKLKKEGGYKPPPVTLPLDLASLATQDFTPCYSGNSPRYSGNSPRSEIPALANSDYMTDADLDMLHNKTLNRSVAEIIKHLQPNKKAELQRYSVLSFLKCLVRKLGAQVYPHGSYALKT